MSGVRHRPHPVAPVPVGLIREYRFTAGGGTVLYDRGSGSDHGGFVNSPAWGATGVDFVPGESDHITTTMIPPVNGTMQILFAPDTFAAARTLAGCLDAASGRLLMSAGDGTSNILAAGLGSHASTTIKGTSTLIATNWYLGTLTWNGSLVELWVNAAKEYSAAQSGVPTTSIVLTIGGRNTNGTIGNFYDGKLGWIAVYNRVLSQASILHNLNFARRLAASRGVTV